MDDLLREPDPSPGQVQEPAPPPPPAPLVVQAMPADTVVPYVEPKAPSQRLAIATPADLTFVDSLQKKFGRSLGFLPRQALEVNLEKGHVHLCRENDEPAGYLLVRPVLSWQPLLRAIIQAAVCMDAQRRHNGLALLLRVEADARAAGQVALQANCAVGVEANEFWAAAGFKPIAHLTPETKSGREIICWRKPLQRSLPSWFTDLPTRAGHRSAGTNSTRNHHRTAKSLEFAQKFAAGRPLVHGNPAAAGSGLIRSDSPEGQAILEGKS